MIKLAAAIAMMLVAVTAHAQTYYAEIDANGVVKQVIVADSATIAKRPGRWIQTWMDGGSRKNYAGLGHTFDIRRNAFISPKPYPSWALNETTARWEPPVPRPSSVGLYRWDETFMKWMPER